MYAVIEVGGKQYRVSEGDRVEVERLPLAVGEGLEIDRVLLLGGQGQPMVGTPTVTGAKVKARVVEHGQGRKVIVFKFHRDNRYQRKQGHRQGYTRLAIESIVAKEEKVAKAKARKAAPRKKVTPLEELGLSKRTLSSLKKAGIESVEALEVELKKGEEALLALPGFGPKSWEEVNERLRRG